MAAVNTMSTRWPEAVTATQQEIEATNARIEKEWERLRAADAGLPEGGLRIDAGGLELAAGARRAGADSWETGSIGWRLEAIAWRLKVVNRWLDDVLARVASAKDRQDKDRQDVEAIVLGAVPPIEYIEYLFQEIKTYAGEVGALTQRLRTRRWPPVGNALLGLTAAAVGGGAGTGLALLANWIGQS